MRAKSEIEKVQAVEKVLGEPVFPEFSPNAWKVRTNLIAFAVIAVAVMLADLRIDQESTVFGLRFSGIIDQILRTGLLLVIVYLTIHFLWLAVDGFLEWRIRITGTRVSFVTTGKFASDEADYPDDPRQSTLYGWWNSEAKKIGNISDGLPKIMELLKAKYHEDAARTPTETLWSRHFSDCRRTLEGLDKSIKEAQKTLASMRIPVSLGRFDRWFQFFLRSQNLRWFLIDLLVPIVLSGSAIYLFLRW